MGAVVGVPVADRSYDRCYPQIFMNSPDKGKIRG
ncbi:hypothetical protein SAMN05428987_5502 [Paenibacillus sp. CF095]|nr:hypothetical protein [Paenibacillus sp. 2003]SDD64150.1 hypothetical protein SAMN05428987_5502 [Paenibacillus sp. CF095]